MEYLSKRGTMATEDMEEKKKDLTGRKKKDPDSKIRQAIGKPLELIPSPEEVKSGGEQLCSRRNYLRHRAGKGHFWHTCLQCGGRWERLEANIFKFNANGSDHGVPITQRTCHHQEEDQICQPTT